MIDYLNLTTARLWDIFAAGVPNWTTRVKAGNSLKRLIEDDRAKYKAMIARAVNDFPQLDIEPVFIDGNSFLGPTARTFGNLSGTPGIGCPIVTDDAVTWQFTVTCSAGDYSSFATIWPLMQAAIYKSTAKFSLIPFDLADGELAWVRSWQGFKGALSRPEVLNEAPVLVNRPQMVVRYVFTETNLYE